MNAFFFGLNRERERVRTPHLKALLREILQTQLVGFNRLYRRVRKVEGPEHNRISPVTVKWTAYSQVPTRD